MDNLTVLHTSAISIVLEPVEQIPVGTAAYSLSSNAFPDDSCENIADCDECIFKDSTQHKYYCNLAQKRHRLYYLASKLPHLVSQYPECLI